LNFDEWHHPKSPFGDNGFSNGDVETPSTVVVGDDFHFHHVACDENEHLFVVGSIWCSWFGSILSIISFDEVLSSILTMNDLFLAFSYVVVEVLGFFLGVSVGKIDST